jgi:hypothetical protein
MSADDKDKKGSTISGGEILDDRQVTAVVIYEKGMYGHTSEVPRWPT